jgi:cytochrome c
MQAQSQPARQTPPQVAALPDQAPGATRQEGPSFLSTRDLIGTEVVDRDNPGRTLGRVASVIMDRDSGRARYVTLEWGGYLGWDRNRVLVPYSLLGFSGRWDRPTLKAPASKIENAPQLREQDLNALLTDPDWRRAVADYFGLGPGEAAQQAGAEPAGPRQAAQGTTVAAVSNPTGDVSDPKAQPGEGATGPTAGTGSRDAQTTTAMTSPSAQSGGPDQPHGQALAQRVCAACHTLNQGGATRVGPNLFGVADRPIASVPGYNYSGALKSHQGNWNQANLDAFLKSPRGFAPGTYMTFAGFSSDRDRRDVVAYLESLKAGASR